jgi:hypothetical protein
MAAGLWLGPGLSSAALTAAALSSATMATGCGKPQTPMAHLHGQAWVTGTYEHYGQTYASLQRDAEDKSEAAYGVLAQKGVTALDDLQQREVPFHARLDEAGQRFTIHRNVPERLTFTAEMSEADRELAKTQWETAREHVHTDYAEIQRLNWALTQLLEQLQRIHHAIDATVMEQYRLTRQLAEVKEGELPFELPRDVSPSDYERVLVLLVERLDDDRERLETVQTQILATGLVARSTDAGSASLAANLKKVLVAVVEDAAASSPRPNQYPDGEGQEEALTRGRELVAQIAASEEYIDWLEREETAWLEQVGAFLSIVDAATGIPVSKAYNKAVDIFRGGGDYLDYLELVASFSPSPELGRAVGDALRLTRKVRTGVETAQKVLEGDPSEALGALVNTGTKHARKQLGKQLSFFEDQLELDAVSDKLDATALMRRALPVP